MSGKGIILRDNSKVVYDTLKSLRKAYYLGRSTSFTAKLTEQEKACLVTVLELVIKFALEDIFPFEINTGEDNGNS